MATSLVDTIAQSMSSGLISRFSAATGESASHVQTGLSAAVRAITASMAMRADDPEAMAQIHAMAVEPANDLSLPDRTEGLVSRAISGSSQVTSSDFIQSLLLGNRTSNMADSLASDAGVSKATARSMFSIATSLVLSSLGKVIRTDRLDSAALSSRLADERESIVAGLPAGLSKFYPSVGATAQDVAATIPSRAPVAAARVATAEKQRTAWTWALPAAIAALAVWAIASFFGHSRAPESGRNMTEPGAAATSGFVKRELPGGVSLRFPPNGTEARLLDFIKGSGSITKENWFEFDRLHFATDSAVLESGSREQLSNVAAILKAYPAASVKIGGYTDNSGDPAANLRLSQERAEAVRDELHGMGIDASRLTAEGYGEQHPIADNNTAEGRMQNRRVAIHVTAR
jgi:outer membrane protein OmpA-like peptidoglycan-associated protein